MKKGLKYGSIAFTLLLADYPGDGLAFDHPGRRPLVIRGHLPLGVG